MHAALRWVRWPAITIAALLAAAASPAQAPGTHFDEARRISAIAAPASNHAPLLLIALGVAALAAARRPSGNTD